MKLFLIALLAIAAVNAAENYDGPEWAPIDWANVVPVTDVPGFWDDKSAFHKFVSPVNSDRRIVGGEIATPNSHPYQVGLLMTIFGPLTSLCGASIINQLTILTAAHCPINTQSTLVIAGAHNINQIEASQQRRTAPSANYRLHPNYNSQNLNNDIAIIQITTGGPLVFTPQVLPVGLPRNFVGESFVGERGTSTGWGRIADGGGTSPVLRVVDNDIITNDACAAVFGDAVVNANVICIDTTGGRGTCQGDSGGVLSVVRGGSRFQVGVTSFGAAAGCQAGFPAGFERVTGHFAWLDENTLG